MNIREAFKDYRRVEQALIYISENPGNKPSLKELSASSGLSEYHFHRVFTRWAGISPGRFIKYLTKEHVKKILLNSKNILDATYRSGLSSSSRLHDLIVSTEAVSPGQLKSGGKSLNMYYGVHPSPFGRCLIAVTDKGICHLSFLTEDSGKSEVDELKLEWSSARIVRDQYLTAKFIERIFNKNLKDIPERLNLYIRGTNFQLKVWEALLKIPPGFMLSYEDTALIAGRPDAVRAVASAVARNPISFIIPCHRVIRKMGVIHNYRWGKEKKLAILGWEQVKKNEL